MAAKRRKVAFAEGQPDVRIIPKRSRTEDDEHRQPIAAGWEGPSDVPAASHTLDSDEEDAEDKIKSVYKETDEDQHEDLDTGFTDGGVRVTGFNLNDEMDEGHFDENGNYVPQRDKEAAEDVWYEEANIYKPKAPAVEEDSDSDEAPLRSRLELLKAILGALHPGETTTKAMRRLGGQPVADRKFRAGASKPVAAPADLAAVSALTEAMNEVLAGGYIDIYQDTYEKIAHEIRQLERDPADIVFDKGGAQHDGGDEGGAAAEAPADDPNAVMFEFKWENKPEAEVHGPYSARHMLDWQDQGYFPGEVFCRETRKGPDAPFYSSKRIDFELY